jgi:AraC-like DNA-binding protein
VCGGTPTPALPRKREREETKTADLSMRLMELRLRHAADLLAHEPLRRISDIAFDCGFNDLSYFNRCFRRRFGLTPTAARGK